LANLQSFNTSGSICHWSRLKLKLGRTWS